MSFHLKKNYYEALGVNFDATPEDIDQAFERGRRLFSEGSEAAYSLYSEDERLGRLETLEEAYRTLSNRELKKEYDEALAKAAPHDGTYEVDLGYIFAGQGSGAQLPPEPVRPSRGYRKAAFVKQISVLDKSEAVAAEQFKLLSSKLELANRKTGQKAIAFTSSIKGEGKSVISLNTAFILATAFGKNVAFVECDLRKPSSLQEYISAEGPGLSEVLKGEAKLEEAICSVEDTGLHIIKAGEYDENAADLIGTIGTFDVINSLKRNFDFVLLDCPPVIPLADMSIIEKLVDGIVFIVRAGMTSKELVRSAVESLEKKKFIGSVLNGAETKLDKYYY